MLKEISSFNDVYTLTRPNFFCEKIATIVVAVATIVVDQIATIVVAIVTIVVFCDNCEHCDSCDNIIPTC